MSTSPDHIRAEEDDDEEALPTLLLVWDAPNLDMGLGSLVGGRPTSEQRPRFDAIGRWLLETADRRGWEAEAAVFANIMPGAADSVRPWVDALRNMGFAVFAKPKITEHSDVDEDMTAHIARRRSEDRLAGVVVASADGRNFVEPLEELADAGLPVWVLGFQEHATWALDNPRFTFVDLEDIPGVFREPLPRVNLDRLPPEGAWLRPLRSLRALLRHDDA